MRISLFHTTSPIVRRFHSYIRKDTHLYLMSIKKKKPEPSELDHLFRRGSAHRLIWNANPICKPQQELQLILIKSRNRFVLEHLFSQVQDASKWNLSNFPTLEIVDPVQTLKQDSHTFQEVSVIDHSSNEGTTKYKWGGGVFVWGHTMQHEGFSLPTRDWNCTSSGSGSMEFQALNCQGSPKV